MNVITISITAAGRALAGRLPYAWRPGPLMDAVREEWGRRDAVVLIAANGIAVRAIAPLLAAKRDDPAVLAVDDAGRHVVVLAGGHHLGNELAHDVAALIGATPVVSTATDLAGLPGLDTLPGFAAEGDVAGVTRLWLDGAAPDVVVDEALADWPQPTLADRPALAEEPPARPGGGSVVVTDSDRVPGPGEVLLRPPSLVIGVGASSGANTESLLSLADGALSGAGLDRRAVGAVATIDLKAAEPAVVALADSLGVPLTTFPAPRLAGQSVPNPSPVVAAAVATPSVSEAAALMAAGPGAELVVEKSVSDSRDSTVAIARRRRPEGHLWLVGLGPGHPGRRTPEAATAVRHADVVIGYSLYVDQAADLLRPGQEVVRSPIGAESERCADALRRAAAGANVALVCSGDPGVYAMASLVCELAPTEGDPPVTVVPGVTAALAAAAILGAPLGHDHASISLSDLLTPWEVIARRVHAVAEADFVVSIYNPRSRQRTTQLGEALAALRKHRPAGTPAAVATDVGRPGQSILRTTLDALDPDSVGMLSLVVVGSSRTRWMGDRMVTPRGYLP